MKEKIVYFSQNGMLKMVNKVGRGSVKYFVSQVINGSFLVRIKI